MVKWWVYAQSTIAVISERGRKVWGVGEGGGECTKVVVVVIMVTVM